MTSRSNPSHDNNDSGGPDDSRNRMTENAVRYSRTSLKDRIIMQEIVKSLDRHDADASGTPASPPGPFRAALRRPVGSKRKPVTVTIAGRPVSILLNPQGRVDVEREQWLWEYVRDLVEGGKSA